MGITGHQFINAGAHQECKGCGTRPHWPAAKDRCPNTLFSGHQKAKLRQAKAKEALKALPPKAPATPIALQATPNPREPISEVRYIGNAQLFEGTFARQALQRVIFLDSEAVIRAAMATALRGVEPEYAVEILEACEWYYRRAEEGAAQDKCRKLYKSLKLLLAANVSAVG